MQNLTTGEAVYGVLSFVGIGMTAKKITAKAYELYPKWARKRHYYLVEASIRNSLRNQPLYFSCSKCRGRDNIYNVTAAGHQKYNYRNKHNIKRPAFCNVRNHTKQFYLLERIKTMLSNADAVNGLCFDCPGERCLQRVHLLKAIQKECNSEFIDLGREQRLANY